MITPARPAGEFDKHELDLIEQVKEIVSGVRTVRKEKNIAIKDTLDLFINTGDDAWPKAYESIICKLGNVDKLEMATEKIDDATSFLVRTHELYIPVGDMIDKEAELERLTKELEYNRGFLSSVMKKLGNERFVNNAPEKVVDVERKKKADAEQKIKTLEEQIANLS